MKKLLIGMLLLSGLGSFSACKDASKIPAPEVTSVPLISPVASPDPEKDHFDQQRAAASVDGLPSLPNPTRPVFEFTFDIPDQRDIQLRTVEVYKSFQRGNNIGPRVLAGSYSSFPARVSINSQDALTGLQRLYTSAGLAIVTPLLGVNSAARNQVLSGDRIVFTFEYVLQDGSRVILTPLADVKLASGGTVKVISGNQVNPPYSIYGRIFVR